MFNELGSSLQFGGNLCLFLPNDKHLISYFIQTHYEISKFFNKNQSIYSQMPTKAPPKMKDDTAITFEDDSGEDIEITVDDENLDVGGEEEEVSEVESMRDPGNYVFLVLTSRLP